MKDRRKSSSLNRETPNSSARIRERTHYDSESEPYLVEIEFSFEYPDWCRIRKSQAWKNLMDCLLVSPDEEIRD